MPARHLFRIVVALILGGIVLTNVALISQNRLLKRSLTVALGDRDFQPGDRFPIFSGVASDGTLTSIQPRGERQVIIYFSPTCDYSRSNMEGYRRLSSALRDQGLSLIWVSGTALELTNRYAIKESIDGLVLSAIPYQDFRSLGLNYVPKLTVVNEEGRVEKTWKGALSGAQWKEVDAYFGLE